MFYPRHMARSNPLRFTDPNAPESIQLALYKRMRQFSVLVSFKNTTFEYVQGRPLISDSSFTIEEGSKVTIMGQNGSGKSTILKLLNGSLTQTSGFINKRPGLVVSTAMQVMPRDCLDLTILEFFKKQLQGNASGIDSRVARVLQEVQLDAPYERVVKTFSGTLRI